MLNEPQADKLLILASNLRETLEMLKRVDYALSAATEQSPAFLIGWTKGELQKAIEALEASRA